MSEAENQEFKMNYYLEKGEETGLGLQLTHTSLSDGNMRQTDVQDNISSDILESGGLA